MQRPLPSRRPTRTARHTATPSIPPLLDPLEPRRLFAAAPARDLAVTITTPPQPQTYVPGDHIDLNALGINVNVTGSFPDRSYTGVSVYLSRETTLDSLGSEREYLIGAVFFDELFATAPSPGPHQVMFPDSFVPTVPDFLPPGDYYLIAHTDVFGTPPDANSVNDTASTPSPVVRIAATDTNTTRAIGVAPDDAGSTAVNLPDVGIRVRASARQPDGKVIIVGNAFDSVRSGFGFFAARLNLDGSLDASFANGGIATIGFGEDSVAFANAVAVGTDGKIVIGGEVDSDRLVPAFGLVRLNTNGTLDQSFGHDGRVVSRFLQTHMKFFSDGDVIRDLSVLPDNSILVAGSETRNSLHDDEGRFVAARYTPSGTLDKSFGNGGKVLLELSAKNDLYEGAYSLVISPTSGDVVLAGESRDSDLVSRFTALSLTPTGAVNRSFGSAGTASIHVTPTSTFAPDFDDERATEAAYDASGNLLLAGIVTRALLEIHEVTALAVARLTPDGAPDLTFGTGGSIAIPIPGLPFATVDQLVPLTDGRILLVGRAAASAEDLDANRLVPFAVRLLPNGQPDTTFSPTGIVLLFQPPPAAGPAAPGPLAASAAATAGATNQSTFDAFANSSAVLVSITPGGGIAVIAAQVTDTGTVLQVMTLSPDATAVIPATPTADLAAALAGKLPRNAAPATAAHLKLTVTNVGLTAVAAPAVPVRLVLSTDNTLSDDDRPVATATVPLALPTGKHATRPVVVTLPPDLPAPATYYLFAIINPADATPPAAVPENNRANNTTRPLGPVAVKPKTRGKLAPAPARPVTPPSQPGVRHTAPPFSTTFDPTLPRTLDPNSDNDRRPFADTPIHP